MTDEDLSPPPVPLPRSRALARVCALVLAAVLSVAVVLFWVYGFDTHHADRGSIWWPGRVHGLTPPAATEITLQRDILDHYALYTISEADLNAFLDERFAREGETLDSFAERSPPRAELIGRPIGPFGWVVPAGAVVYHYGMSNGAMSTFYHDPVSGRTYQDSAHW